MSNRLDQAFRALREIEDGRHPGADETLAQVLGELRAPRIRRSRPVAVRVWLLAAAILVVSTAAAARGGSWSRVLRAFSLGSAPSPAAVTPAAMAAPPPVQAAPSLDALQTGPAPSLVPPVVMGPPTGGSLPARATLDAHRPAADSVPPRASTSTGAAGPAGAASSIRASAVPSASVASSTSTGAAGPAGAASSIRASAVPSASAASSIRASAVPSASTGSADAADDAAFARAHRLHFAGSDTRAALDAWDDYLRRFPGGRFAPEARYNRAIDLLRLGRAAEARDALQAFANGNYGDYRRDEARAILRSLP